MSSLAHARQSLAQERGDLLRRLDAALRADLDVLAAWQTGSLARGDADGWSDVDLFLAIADERCASLNAQRRAFVARFGEPLLVQEAPQNAPPGGTFLLVLYAGTALPLQVDWSWQPASTAHIPEHAHVLFDRVGLPRDSSWLSLSPAEVAQRVSLATTLFWAMAFIATRKILRRQPAAAFDLLRLMRQAQERVQALLRGDPVVVWGAVASPASGEALPPVQPDTQLLYLERLVDTMAALQPTADGAGGLVTDAATEAVRRFVRLAHEELARR